MAGFLRKAWQALGGGEKTKPAARPGAPRPKAGKDRQELLRKAEAMRRGKRKMLDELGEEDRARLLAMAILAFGDEVDRGRK